MVFFDDVWDTCIQRRRITNPSTCYGEFPATEDRQVQTPSALGPAEVGSAPSELGDVKRKGWASLNFQPGRILAEIDAVENVTLQLAFVQVGDAGFSATVGSPESRIPLRIVR